MHLETISKALIMKLIKSVTVLRPTVNNNYEIRSD